MQRSLDKLSSSRVWMPNLQILLCAKHFAIKIHEQILLCDESALSHILSLNTQSQAQQREILRRPSLKRRRGRKSAGGRDTCKMQSRARALINCELHIVMSVCRWSCSNEGAALLRDICKSLHAPRLLGTRDERRVDLCRHEHICIFTHSQIMHAPVSNMTFSWRSHSTLKYAKIGTQNKIDACSIFLVLTRIHESVIILLNFVSLKFGSWNAYCLQTIFFKFKSHPDLSYFYNCYIACF